MSIPEPTHAARVHDHLQHRSSKLRWGLLAGLIVVLLGAAAASIHAGKGDGAPDMAPLPIHAENLTARAPTVAMPSFADLVDNVRQAVVSVRATAEAEADAASDDGNPFAGTPLERFFRGRPRKNGDASPPDSSRRHVVALGSGFVITEDGYIVTNDHVVDKAVKVEVVMDDGAVIPAKVIGTDATTDLALLRIEHRRNLPFVTLADAAPRVGEWVVAMGNPYGLGGTVTAGIVSAKGRDIGSGPFDSYIQIDAPVNRGNSGGPTFNMSGQVIGVNTAIFSPSGGSIGIAFDIPATMVKAVATELREHGRVHRGWLGVVTQPVTSDIAESLGMKDAAGALVAGVQPDSPAAEAGLAAGDVIAEVDGKTIKDAHDLARQIGINQPGNTVKLTIRRKGRTETLAIKLQALKDTATPQGVVRGATP
jgi:serine protease Do